MAKEAYLDAGSRRSGHLENNVNERSSLRYLPVNTGSTSGCRTKINHEVSNRPEADSGSGDGVKTAGSITGTYKLLVEP